MRSHYLSILLYLPCTASFAFFCPNSFNQIYAGSTMEEVIATCGKPDKQETQEIKSQPPQEWSYFIPQAPTLINGMTSRGNLKTQIVFDASGKAINITINNMSTNNTQICGRMIQLGDTRDTIEAACGKPSFINKQNPEASPGELSNALGNTPPPMQITTFTYGSTTLTFENGKLKEK